MQIFESLEEHLEQSTSRVRHTTHKVALGGLGGERLALRSGKAEPSRQLIVFDSDLRTWHVPCLETYTNRDSCGRDETFPRPSGTTRCSH